MFFKKSREKKILRFFSLDRGKQNRAPTSSDFLSLELLLGLKLWFSRFWAFGYFSQFFVQFMCFYTFLNRPTWPLFHLFLSFLLTVQINSEACWIRTLIWGVEGKDADHYTTTTMANLLLYLVYLRLLIVLRRFRIIQE